MKMLKESLWDSVKKSSDDTKTHIDNIIGLSSASRTLLKMERDGAISHDEVKLLALTVAAADVISDPVPEAVEHVVRRMHPEYKGSLVEFAAVTAFMRYDRLAVRYISSAESLFNNYSSYPDVLEHAFENAKKVIEGMRKLMQYAITNEDLKDKTPEAEKKYRDLIKYYNAKVIPASNYMIKVINTTLKECQRGDALKAKEKFDKEGEGFGKIIIDLITKKLKDYCDVQYPGMD